MFSESFTTKKPFLARALISVALCVLQSYSENEAPNPDNVGEKGVKVERAQEDPVQLPARQLRKQRTGRTTKSENSEPKELFDELENSSATRTVEIFNEASNLHPSRSSVLESLAMAKLAHIDPDKGWDILDELTPGTRRMQLIHSFFSSLNPEFHSQAEEWVASLPYREDKSPAIRAFTNGLGKLPPEDIVKTIRMLESNSDLQRAANRALGHATANGDKSLEETLEYTASLEKQQPEVIRAWTAQRSVSGGQEVFKDVLRSALPNNFKEELLILALGNIGMDSPDVAVELVSDTWGPNAPRSALASTLSNWLRSDPMSASAWAAELEAGSTRDFAALEIVKYLARKNSSGEAVTWIDLIGSEAAKQEALSEIE